MTSGSLVDLNEFGLMLLLRPRAAIGLVDPACIRGRRCRCIGQPVPAWARGSFRRQRTRAGQSRGIFCEHGGDAEGLSRPSAWVRRGLAQPPASVRDGVEASSAEGPVWTRRWNSPRRLRACYQQPDPLTMRQALATRQRFEARAGTDNTTDNTNQPLRREAEEVGEALRSW